MADDKDLLFDEEAQRHVRMAMRISRYCSKTECVQCPFSKRSEDHRVCQLTATLPVKWFAKEDKRRED